MMLDKAVDALDVTALIAYNHVFIFAGVAGGYVHASVAVVDWRTAHASTRPSVA